MGVGEKLMVDYASYWNRLDSLDEIKQTTAWRAGTKLSEQDWLAGGDELFGYFELIRHHVGEPSRILQWGIGGGCILARFNAEFGCHCTGVDISDLRRRETERYFALEELSLHDEREIMQRGLPTDEPPFDLILLTDYLHLVPKRSYARRLIELALGHLRPGGGILLSYRFGRKSQISDPGSYDEAYPDLARFGVYEMDVLLKSHGVHTFDIGFKSEDLAYIAGYKKEDADE